MTIGTVRQRRSSLQTVCVETTVIVF